MKVDLCVSSFPNANTSSRVVVFRAGLFELPVRLAVLRSPVRLVILSVRLYSSVGLFDSSFYEVDSLLTTPVRHCLSLCHFVVSFIMPFHHFDVAFHRFDPSTKRGYNSSYITWSVAWCHADTKNIWSIYPLFALCQLKMEPLKSATYVMTLPLESHEWSFSWKRKWDCTSSNTPTSWWSWQITTKAIVKFSECMGGPSINITKIVLQY